MTDRSLPVPHAEEKFSPAFFLLTIGLTLAGFLLAVKFLAPSVWASQLKASAWLIVAAFVVIKLFNCFFEFFLHRYVLHKPAIPGLSHFYRQHTHHHNLTRICMRRTPGGREIPFVENLYPITEPEQGEASFFPWYSLAVFGLVLTPLLIALHLAFPALPWFLGGYVALCASMALYELLHAVEHFPFETWARLIENPRSGAVWRKIYSFHLRHHAVIDCNEAISGFFGLPVADWVFGTCVLPSSLYTHGGTTAAGEFTSPKPRSFIRWLDRAADRVVASRRARVAAAASSSDNPTTTEGRAYSSGERAAHWLSHGLGLVAGIVSLVVLTVFASLRGDTWHIVSFTIFGITILLVSIASLLYHSAKTPRSKNALHRFDRAAIFLLIAGTYTPFFLVTLRGPWGWSLFGAVWAICAVGASLQLIFGSRFRAACIVARVVATGLILVAFEPLISTVPASGLWLLLAGGSCYLVATLLYAWRRLRYHHAMRRVMVLGGSCCHVLAVLLFVLPASH